MVGINGQHASELCDFTSFESGLEVVARRGLICDCVLSARFTSAELGDVFSCSYMG